MAPLEFLTALRREFRSAGIRFAITSGQACVHYAIQQTTKDSDWIIALDDIERLRQQLAGWKAGEDGRAGYRSICGAPLDREYLQHGWTSHLAVLRPSSTAEHHVDIFGKPPRVQEWETDPDDADISSRHVVAQMKKTDRDKDWPIVFTIGRQMLDRGDWRGLLHLQDAEALITAWPHAPPETRGELLRQRPLLALVESSPHQLRRAIAIERSIWAAVNRARYSCYSQCWKQFFRRWRDEPGMQWPLDEPLARQHEILLAACEKHRLPRHPFDEAARRGALARGLADTTEIMAATPKELELITPPLEVLLP